MRRALVIFLIPLFPLNVCALSLPVSSMQQSDAATMGAPDMPPR